MPESALGRVRRAVRTGSPDPVWMQGLDRIRLERQRVLDHLADASTASVYGFTSSLGELDGSLANPGEAALLEAHLIGPTRAAPDGLLRTMSACKLEQLHLGGTGVPPELFLLTAESLGRDGGSLEGAWHASYGAGDVVPAAWWLHTFVAPGRSLDGMPGATISMISGSFVGAAHAALLAERSSMLGERLLAVVDRHRDRLRSERAAQASISERDTAPLVDELHRGATALEEAIEARLVTRSGNPLFDVGDDVVARSQNSYLDFNLTAAVRRWMQSVVVGTSWLHRLATLENQRLLRDGCLRPAAVQPPKVANALLLDIKRHAAGTPLDFVSYDSDGVEDVRDLAVAHCRAGSDMLDAVEALLDVLEG